MSASRPWYEVEPEAPALTDEERAAAEAERERRRAKNRHDRKVKDARADKLRDDLLAILAPEGLCAKCGIKPYQYLLQIDHVNGRQGWQPRDYDRVTRYKRYWKEYEAGVELRALCDGCNGGHLNNRNRKRK